MADYDKFAQRLISESSYTPSSLSAEATTLLADLTDAQQRNKSRLMVGRLTHMRARTKQLEEDLKKLNRSGPELGANKAELSALEAEAASAKNDLIAAQAEAKAMRDRVAALESSTSWRITGPMRRIVTAFRRPKVNV